MVIMSRSQDKLQKVADEISELAVNSCSLYPSHSITLPPFFCFTYLTHSSPHSSPPLPHPPPEEKYGREVRIIPVDFSEGPELYPRIAEELHDLDIGVLGKVPSFTQ